MTRRHTPFLIGALALLATLAVACGGGSRSAGGKTLRVGDPAPEFSLPSGQGGTVSLAGLGGKPVLLYFSMGPG